MLLAQIRGILRGRWRLVLLAAALPMLEAIAPRVTGQVSSLGMAPQITAPAPFGLFHDLRRVLVFHASWLSYGWEMAALVVFRTAVTAALVRAAWPAREPRPPVAFFPNESRDGGRC